MAETPGPSNSKRGPVSGLSQPLPQHQTRRSWGPRILSTWSAPPLHSLWGSRRSGARGSLSTCAHPSRERAPRPLGSHCSPEASVRGLQPLPSAPSSPRPLPKVPVQRDWGCPSAFPFPGLVITTKPLNLATCCRHHLPGRLPELGAGGPRRAVRKKLRPQEGLGGSPAVGKQGSCPLPFSSCRSRLDFKSYTSGISMRAQSRGLAPRRGSGRGCSGWAGAGAQLGPLPQPVALPHRHRGLHGPVTPLRDPASFRSAGDHAGRGWAAPSPWRPSPRRPGVRAGPASMRSCSLERPPGSRHLRTAPRPPAPLARASPGRTGRRASWQGSRWGTYPPAHLRGCPPGAAPTAGWARCRCPGTSTPPSPGGTAFWRLRARPPAANFEVGAHGPAAARGAAGAGRARSCEGRPGGDSGDEARCHPSGGLAPPRPKPPVHAAPSLVGLRAGAPQGWWGRRRSGLSAPAAERCARRAGSSVPRALRAARHQLVRWPARLPSPPLRLSPPPRLARSLALCRAGCAPASPARRLSARPLRAARPFPPPAPEGPPQARWGFLLPLPRLPLSPRGGSLAPHCSHQDQDEVRPFLPAPWTAPTPLELRAGTGGPETWQRG